MFLDIPGFNSKSNLVLRHQHYLSVGIVSMLVPCSDLDELASSGIVDLNTGMLIFGIGYHHCCIASVQVFRVDWARFVMADESANHRVSARHCPAGSSCTLFPFHTGVPGCGVVGRNV